MENDWGRPCYEPGGGDAFVLFTVFGRLPEPLAMSATRHRATEIPAGVELQKLDAADAASILAPPLGPTLLADWDGDSPDKLAADGCILLRGEVTDPADLRYLRNAIGIVTALLEGGGKAALNLQALLLFSSERWMNHIFEADKPHPRHHVAILTPNSRGLGQRDGYGFTRVVYGSSGDRISASAMFRARVAYGGGPLQSLRRNARFRRGHPGWPARSSVQNSRRNDLSSPWRPGESGL